MQRARDHGHSGRTQPARKRGRPFDAAPPFALPTPLPTDLLGFNIIRLAHLKKARDDGLFKLELGIGLIQFGLLMLLQKVPGLGAGQLARWLLITPQSTAHLIADLQKMRLLNRETGPRRRGTRIKVELTRKGRLLIERGRVILERAETEVRVALSRDEAVSLNNMLIRVAEAYVDLSRREQLSAPKRRQEPTRRKRA